MRTTAAARAKKFLLSSTAFTELDKMIAALNAPQSSHLVDEIQPALEKCCSISQISDTSSNPEGPPKICLAMLFFERTYNKKSLLSMVNFTKEVSRLGTYMKG